MDKDVKSTIDKLAQGSYEEIKSLIDTPYTWEFTKKGIEHQGEVVAVWEDKEKGTIRLIGYETSSRRKWLNQFFSKSSYEKIIEP